MNELIKVNLDTQTVSAREPSCQFSDEFIEMAIELGKVDLSEWCANRTKTIIRVDATE